MKRMVLIPEEKLLQYEQQQKSVVSHDARNRQYGLGEREHDVPSNQYGRGEERKELSDDIIVRGIPKTMRTRAIALLERLKARPDVISWDDMGQVKIDGVFIPKSNISDLVSSAMRSRKYFDPIASQKFFNVLSNINVPKDLVRNEEGWRKVTQKGKGEDWGEVWDFVNPIFGGGKGRGKREKPGEGHREATQKGKGNIFSDDFLKEVREMKRLMRTNVRASIFKGGGQKGKGELGNDFLGAWYHLEKTPWKGTGRGKRKKPQEGGFAFGPYTQGLSGIEKKHRALQKGGGLHKIPNWECYKG